ncbi:Type I restriction-modification system, specificity subunit S [hydrothermal vent metagenome]|uniref:Type I restriction-modification system, specificity subunit S n=1 Tax=hydrothermal vent metagenome TaxID=652676 RepID=A0A1W1BZR8_9ZZZZ
MTQYKKLGEFAKIQGGYAYKSIDFKDTGIPVLKIKNVGKGKLLFDDISYVDEVFIELTSNYITRAGDILISMTGSHINQPASMVGRVAKVSKDDPISLINQRVGRVVLKKNALVDKRFLYYCLSQYKTQLYLVSNGSGSANQININSRLIESVDIPNLPYETTVKIAHILSTLDDKIELNRKMNQTLEEMAQALFKSWFVDFDPVHARANSRESDEVVARELGISKEVLELFPSRFVESELGLIPEGWEVKKISNFGLIVTGKTPPKKVEDAYANGDKPFITPTDIDDSMFVTSTNRYLSRNGQDAIKNSFIASGSICVTCIGSKMGKTTIAPIDSFTNQQINSIVVFNNICRNYLFCNLRNRKKEIFRMGNSGSTMPILNKSAFSKLPIISAEKEILFYFNKKIEDMLSLVLANDMQNITLQKTRDTLLPKLLSGELDVSNIEMELN